MLTRLSKFSSEFPRLEGFDTPVMSSCMEIKTRSAVGIGNQKKTAENSRNDRYLLATLVIINTQIQLRKIHKENNYYSVQYTSDHSCNI